jgi:hypothetical protein
MYCNHILQNAGCPRTIAGYKYFRCVEVKSRTFEPLNSNLRLSFRWLPFGTSPESTAASFFSCKNSVETTIESDCKFSSSCFTSYSRLDRRPLDLLDPSVSLERNSSCCTDREGLVRISSFMSSTSPSRDFLRRPHFHWGVCIYSTSLSSVFDSTNGFFFSLFLLVLPWSTPPSMPS